MNLFEKIKTLAQKRKITIAELERATGISNGQIRRWDFSSPKAENLEKVADYFGVTTDYLLGREKKKLEKNVDLSDDTVIMTYQGKPLSPEDRELILRLMRGKE